MITVDVRLLVRGSGDRSTDEVLEQLLSGVLRVHAVVELPRPDRPYRVVPPVHRLARSAAHHVIVRDWSGEVLR